MWKKRGKVQGELRRYVMEKRKEKILGLLGMKSQNSVTDKLP